MNVVIYARFSSHSQTEQSIEGQLRVCKEYAKKNGHTVIGEYIDRAITGKTDNRPDFQRMIEDSKKKCFQGVLVYALDRFGRNMRQTAINENTLYKNGVILLSATEEFKDDPAGRMYRNISMAFAQYYSDELSEKVKRGQAESASKCQTIGSSPGLGFKVGDDKRFVIDETTAPIVQEIFRMYVNGKTVNEIITTLNERHVLTSKGNPFNKNSLHRMFRNKRYIGIYIYNGQETPGGMPRIIDDETFYKVQEMLDKNKKAPARARAKAEYLLTTKLFCGHCKEMMTGLSGTSHTAAKHNYYICNNRKKKLCNKKNVRKEFIEELVLAECRKLLTDKNINRIAKEIEKISEQEAEPAILQYMRKQLADNERKKKNLLSALMNCREDLQETIYQPLREIEKEIADLQIQIAKEAAGQVRLTASEIKFFLTALKKADPDTAKYKKTLIAIFVNAIYLYDDKITLIFNSGDKPVTITSDLLNDIEKQADAVPEAERFVFSPDCSTKRNLP
ncbi:MAG: recombinase family protein [Eubacteriales bacterium]|nr:recombinase family protein [Eubacteriales bacterium]